ncbi:golgi to ER traffic protein 4 [Acrasis kona]
MSLLELFEYILTLLPKEQHEYRVLYLKAAIKLSSGKTEQADPTLHLLMGREYKENGEYKEANQHYCRSESPEEHAELVQQWSRKGNDDEFDMFAARSILQILCLKKVNYAQRFFDHYITLYNEKDALTPLLNFIDFLFTSITNRSKSLFEYLKIQYKPALNRDPEYESLLKTIGESYFGIRVQESGLAGLFSSFASMLGGPNQSRQ